MLLLLSYPFPPRTEWERAKKYKRRGHLWQGRFKSLYVTDEAYLYTLILYIDQNPLKAKMVKKIEDYPYVTAHYLLKKEPLPLCLKNSYMAQNYREAIEEEWGIGYCYHLTPFIQQS